MSVENMGGEKIKRKKYISYLIYPVIFFLILYFLQRLFVPKYMGRVVEGNFTEEYYQEISPHDVLILGDCEAYENISPIILWKEYGITSYIRGNASQLLSQSYYLLRDSLKTETPKLVILSIAAMQYPEQTNESYNRMVLDGMRWSMDKILAYQASAMEGEHFPDYLFPLLRFHSRWKELEADDFRYFFQKKKRCLKISHLPSYFMDYQYTPIT